MATSTSAHSSIVTKSSRQQITGVLPYPPKTYSDIDAAIKTQLALQTQLAVNKMIEIAKFLLAQQASASIAMVEEINPNLFSLAALYYGDIDAWLDLMNFSFIQTPIVSGVVDGIGVDEIVTQIVSLPKTISSSSSSSPLFPSSSSSPTSSPTSSPSFKNTTTLTSNTAGKNFARSF